MPTLTRTVTHHYAHTANMHTHSHTVTHHYAHTANMHTHSHTLSHTHTHTHTRTLRFAQQEVSLSSFSASSLNSEGDHTHPDGSRTNLYLGSIDSLHDTNTILQSALSVEARELIHFVAARDTHRPPWPFAGKFDSILGFRNRPPPPGKIIGNYVLELYLWLVIVHVDIWNQLSMPIIHVS